MQRDPCSIRRDVEMSGASILVVSKIQVVLTMTFKSHFICELYLT
jgi:hypothetical protein